MYSQATTNMYGQPSYSSHPFPPPPPVNAYHGYYQQHYSQHPPAHYPPQPPVYPVDPNTFRRDYMRSLSELTFNSRPVIQNLSNIAADNLRYADIVVSCIDEHIRRAHPSTKLPAFYLLDAISKNIFDPYARRFASVVSNLFLDTYGQVDLQTRTKMEEMLLTWRNGSPTRSELFGTVNQIAIERGVWGNGNDSAITKGQVLSELQFAIDAKKRALHVNPYDTDAQRKTEVLHQLRKCILEAGVSQEELRQILAQLREIVKSTPTVPQAAPVPPPNAWPAPAYAAPPQPPRQPPAPSFPANPNPFPPAGHTNAAPHPAPPQASSSSALDSAKLSSIISTLVSAGVVSKSGNATPPIASEQTTAPAGNTAEDASFRDYRHAILSQQAKLSSTEILKIKPSIKTFLYTRLPSQCKQCGIRFSDSPHGKQQHQEHLDMHFKQNRKAAWGTGRGHSRHSFQVTEDWIRDADGSVDSKGKGPETSIPSNEKNDIQSDAELRSSFVVVPPGDEAKPISCPICKERIKTEFSEDDEEWIWRNAVLKDEKIYHATCHAEALSSTNTLAARLRSDLISSSRGGTPEVNGSARSTPPSSMRISQSPPRSPDSKVGMKRKVDDMDSELTNKGTGTPPSKKLAMSATS